MKKEIKILLFLTAIQYICYNLAHPVTPTLIKQLNLGSYIFGVSFASMSMGMFLTSPFWGKMTGVLGERKQMAFGSVLYALGQFLFMKSTTPLMIVLSRLIGGFGSGGVIVAGTTYIVRVSDVAQRGRNLTFYTTITTCFGTIGYLIGGVVGDFSIYYAFYIQVAMLLVLAVAFYFMLSDNPNLQKAEMSEIVREANPLKAIINGKEFMNSLLICLFVSAFIASCASTCYDQSFNYFIKDVFNFKPSYNGYIKASVGLVSFIVNMTLCVYIQKKKDLATSLIFIFIGCAVSLFALTHAPNIQMLILINMVYFAINALYLPIMHNLCSTYGNEKTNGLVMGFYNSIKSLGMIAGALVAGFIYSLNPSSPFYVATVLFLVSSIVLIGYKKMKQM